MVKLDASGNSPEHVESINILFKKPDSAPKIRIPASGKIQDIKNLRFKPFWNNISDKFRKMSKDDRKQNRTPDITNNSKAI